MAGAVENAAVIIVCVSRGYKESENCRLEANYAQALHVPKVFVMMQDKKAWVSGWLGKSTPSKYRRSGETPREKQ